MKEKILNLRVTEKEKDIFEKTAAAQKMKLSQWVRMTLLFAATGSIKGETVVRSSAADLDKADVMVEQCQTKVGCPASIISMDSGGSVVVRGLNDSVAKVPAEQIFGDGVTTTAGYKKAQKEKNVASKSMLKRLEVQTGKKFSEDKLPFDICHNCGLMNIRCTCKKG